MNTFETVSHNVRNGISNSLEGEKVSFEIATIPSWEDYRNIKIEAMRSNPTAFSTHPEEELREELNKTREMWLKELRSTERLVLLARQSEKVKGVGVLERDASAAKDSWDISFIYLAPDLRGRGEGEKMMRKILEIIKQRGGKRAGLRVMNLPEQVPALELYRKLGFEIVEEVKEKDAGWSYYVMSLDLRNGKNQAHNLSARAKAGSPPLGV